MSASRIIKVLTKLFFSQFLIVNSLIAQQYGHWEIIDSTNLAHDNHASFVLQDGRIIVTGGLTGYTSFYNRSAEIFNLTTNTWDFIDSMNVSRGEHSMMLLQDGSLLAISGFQEVSCEKYDPNLGDWIFVDSIKKVRDYGFTATRLDDGKVMITGGWYFDGIEDEFIKECELYDPIIDEWSIVDSLSVGRLGHSATLLKDGRVLVIGGLTTNRMLESCEIFDPITRQWSFTDSLLIERGWHSAVLLQNGKVLVTGGGNLDSLAIFTCELFDPVTEKWEIAGVTSFPHSNHTSVLLADSLILLAGGVIGPASWEIFNPKTFSSMYVGTLPFQKYESTLHLLHDARVISVGGWIYEGGWILPTATCLMYYPNVTSIINKRTDVSAYALEQSYPNPFNSAATISYSIPKSELVTLKVFDILGIEVANIVNEHQSAGSYKVEFNAANLPSGIYLYQLRASDFIATKKLIIVK
jgi:hypothetical protein